MLNTIGLYGLGVMGSSLALNIANHGYSISVYNYTEAETDLFMQKLSNQKVSAYKNLADFVNSLEKPRKVIMMVTAGKVVDLVLDQLLPLLEKDDIVIDGGNSYYQDTVRRFNKCSKAEIHFFGVGVSGGEKGALNGPSIMPGGNKEVYKQIEPILNAISAKAKDGKPCCNYIGPDGSGHYVKMVHNGIEYADIQIICEAYQIMREVLKLSIQEIQSVFEKWNSGRLKSYLIEITSEILKVYDDKTGCPIVDVILDTAGQKGTGKWTSIEGLDLGIAIPTIAQSVFARCLSSIKSQRVKASKLLTECTDTKFDKELFVGNLEKAVYCAKIISYAQGFSLLKEASEINQWNLNFGEIAMLWREGCIIRAEFLEDIQKAFNEEKDCVNLIISNQFREVLNKDISGLRKCVLGGIENGVYVPALSSALGYYDGYRSERLPANLLQAQRDYFGAHTYQRIDADPSLSFHTKWEE